MDGLLKGICEVGVFLVVAQTVVCFRPRASYEKYLKFLVGIMVLLLIQTFVLQLLGKEQRSSVEERLEEFYREIEAGRKEALLFQEKGEEDAVWSGDIREDRESRWMDEVSPIRIERIDVGEDSDGGASEEMVSEG